jgi:tellurite resistance protein TerC
VSPAFEGQRFFTRLDGRRAITPLFLVLLVVESTDVVFAVDSIPAIFGVTTDSFLVMTSNVFAILGLRSLFFALSAIMDKFRYLKVGLVVVLIFIGVKMILACETYPILKIPTSLSLGVVVGVLAISVVASLLRRAAAPPMADDQPHPPTN